MIIINIVVEQKPDTLSISMANTTNSGQDGTEEAEKETETANSILIALDKMFRSGKPENVTYKVNL